MSTPFPLCLSTLVVYRKTEEFAVGICSRCCLLRLPRPIIYGAIADRPDDSANSFIKHLERQSVCA